MNNRSTVEGSGRTAEVTLDKTASTWIIEVNDARWRALVELLLPPSEIGKTPCEDEAVGSERERLRSRRPA